MNSYNDDLPDWLQDEESNNDSGKAEIEPPTDGPPPDWMRVATSGSDTSLKDENTPGWLKDIKAGKGKAKENDVNNSEPSTPPSSQDSGSDSLSDWERLLAEEGIDLSTVSEDRPQGSEGMSARDWLIASSDDEMIRKRVGGEPMAEPPVEKPQPPQPEPVAAEQDKMVVEEDLPDWLRDEAEAVAPALEAPDISPVEMDEGLVVEAELPDWLQEFSEEEEAPELAVPAEPVRPGTGPLPGLPAAHDEDKMVVEEDLPEWLREVADEVATEPALAENLSDKSMAGLPISDYGATDDEDLPDWLREAAAGEEAEQAAPEVEPVETPAPAISWGDSMVVEEGLPDWLREVEEEAERSELVVEEAAEAPTLAEEPAAVGGEMPDWLRVAETEEVEAEGLLLEYEAATEAALPLDEAAEIEEEGLPGWLRQAQESQPEAEAQTVPQDQRVVDEELPDWLREVGQEEVAEAGEKAEELPGWLQEAAGAEEFLAPAGEVEAATGVMAAGEDIVDMEGLPDWLQEVQEEEAFEPSEPSPEEEEVFVAEEELTLEGELPDWLRQVQDETQEVTIDEFDLYGEEVEPVGEGEVIVAEELPDWLRGLEEEPEPAAVAAPPVAEVAVAAPEEVEEEAAAPEPEPVVAAAPAPVPVVVEEKKPQPRPAPTGLPDWLRKLRESDREEEKAAVFQTRPASRLVPALAAVEERPMVEIKAEEQVSDLPSDAEERLRLAREAREGGRLEDAVHIYDTLVSSGVYLHQVIEDMQQATKAYPSNYLLYQLMGDAMMREGRLQSALDAYRQALVRL